MGKVITFSEHFFFTMVWVVLVLVGAGIVLHLMSSKGIFPGLASWIGTKTNLQTQAGG